MITDLTYKGKIRNSDDARRFWGKHNRMQKKIEAHFVPKMYQAIRQQLETFLKSINDNGLNYSRANMFSIVSPMPVIKVLKELYLKSAYVEGNFVLNYLGGIPEKGVKRVGSPSFSLGFEELSDVIDEYFRIHMLNKSALPITETTRKMIINHLLNQVDSGVPLDTAIENFREYAITGGLGNKARAVIRANAIVRQESTRALSFGGLIGAYMSGVDVDKIWVTSDDERVRGLPNYPAKYSHVDLDLNSSSLLDSFYNGEKIKFPGDPEASIENTGGCRCTMYFREKPKPKPRTRRLLIDFISDFLAGFFIGINLFNQRVE